MSALKFNLMDLMFVLRQIKIAEANAAGTPIMEIYVDADGNTHDEEGNPYTADSPGVTLAVPTPMSPYGLRTVDGSYNNIVPGREHWGAADQVMPRLLTENYLNDTDGDEMPLGPVGSPVVTNGNYGTPAGATGSPFINGGNFANIADADPRTISNLIVDQSVNNPAAIYAAFRINGSEDPQADMETLLAAKVTQAEADAALAVAQGELNAATLAVAAANTALTDAAQAYDPLDGGSLAALLAAVAGFTAANQLLATETEEFAQAQTVAADPNAAFLALAAEMGLEISPSGSITIMNVAPDEGLSRPFNAWMTFFGQFFDHGLDLINKGNKGTIYIPLEADDPLVTVGPDGIANTGDEVPPEMAFMVLTRADTVDGEAVNQTTPFVDQNQTYTSHPSHQVFLREYMMFEGRPIATGHLLDGADGNSLPTWAEVKAQAASMLGIALEDRDVLNLPLLRTDAYGKFIPDPATGFAQVIVGLGDDGIPNTEDDDVVVGSSGSPINTFTVGAIRTGHAFLDDIAHNAVPGTVYDTDGNPATPGTSVVQADADTDVGNAIATDFQGRKTSYDNELLDRHFITGDGRGNENIGLTTVHHIFHSEHNRQVEQQKLTILQSGDVDFVNEWLLTDLTQGQLDAALAAANGAGQPLVALTNFADTLVWDGERMFQAGRMATEMQYQHLVFEEFARFIQPNIDPFVFNSQPDINPSIFAEFAHVVYRFGHSMLTDPMPRIDGDGNLMDDDLTLIEAFLNPVLFNNDNTISADEGAAAIIRGMTIERGNEIDEFVVNALRNNLLGLPLDLPALNIARGRDTGMPSLNDTRAQLYAASSSSFLKPYDHWTDFAENLKNPISVVNFIAAYGTHEDIVNATTLVEKRDAAWAIVFGGDDAPADRLDFLHGTGAWAGEETGLNLIDLWIGGLAEQQMPFGGMLGSTFNAIFELQLENLQDGDRFYYLTRTQGQNFLTSLEQNAFIKLIMANTDLAQPGADGIRGTADDIIARHVGVDSFGVYDYVLEVNVANQADYDEEDLSASGKDPVGQDAALEAMGLGKVIRNDLSTAGPDSNYIRVQGGEHVTIGGTNGNDTIIADFGDDGIWGDGGDDRIESGAGVDLVNGGGGNDIITDSGDTGDFLKGDEGDDVIANSNGLDIIMGGDGDDAVFVGVDDTEVFAGQGDDFALGGEGVDFLIGGEGDDWLEGAGGFDTLAGDNSELNFDSRIIGHDVLFSGSEEGDIDAESGDDISIIGESVIRTEGMFGFDWGAYVGNTQNADGDLGVAIFTTEQADILRDRFDKVEALSGWTQDDVLKGDDRIYDPLANAPGNITALGEGRFFRDEINQEGIDRIDGLDEIITEDLMFLGTYGSDFSDTEQLIFSGGNVLIGGGGDDELYGRGGNDILDGDKYLNVRIRITEPGEANTEGNEIATIASMKHVFTTPEATAAGHAEWAGKSLFELMISRQVVPNQLHIVREILDGGQVGDVDTAVFWDVRENYDISIADDGTVTVNHITVSNPAVMPPGFNTGPVSDGVDTVRNVEMFRFGDGNGGFNTFSLAGLLNDAPTGAAIINNLVPREGDTLSVNTATIADANGLGAFSRQWQSSTDGVTWNNIVGATGTTLALANPGGQTLSALAGQQIRVVVSYTDGAGFAETVTSAATGPVGISWTALLSPTPVTFTSFDGNDGLTGSIFGDTLNAAGGDDTVAAGLGADTVLGGAGNDRLMGQAGDDVLTGGAGDDSVEGGANQDTAVFVGNVLNFNVAATGVGTTIVVTDTTGAEGVDTLTSIETLRFNGVNYQTVFGTNGANNPLTTAAGNVNEVVFGLNGADVINARGGNDIIVGGAGDDRVNGQGGDDFFMQVGATDGRDRVDGGDGTDTYMLFGSAGAETFHIYTRSAAELAGFAIGSPTADIVITRAAGGPESVIAELTSIEEIKINSLLVSANDGGGVNTGASNGDTIIVTGDFTTTALDYSTITIAGSSASDTVDITGLTSDHRVVFASNGGADTILGQVREQDVFTGQALNDQRVQTQAAAATGIEAMVGGTEASDFGAGDGLEALVSGLTHTRVKLDLASLTAGDNLGLNQVGRFGVELNSVSDAFDLSDFLMQTDLSGLGGPLSPTMIDDADLFPLDMAPAVPVAMMFGPVGIDSAAIDMRFAISSEYAVLPF